MCFGLGLIFGVLVISKAPLSSSKTEHFIVLLQSDTFITALASLRKCIVDVVSLRDVYKTMCSALVVYNAISVWSLVFQLIGHPERLTMHLVFEHNEAGSSAFDSSKNLTKSASTRTFNPLPHPVYA